MRRFFNWVAHPENVTIALLTIMFIILITAAFCTRNSPENYPGGVVVEKNERGTRMRIRVNNNGDYGYRTIRTTRYEFDSYSVGDKIPEYFQR
jgi:hypothetical protein